MRSPGQCSYINDCTSTLLAALNHFSEHNKSGKKGHIEPTAAAASLLHTTLDFIPQTQGMRFIQNNVSDTTSSPRQSSRQERAELTRKTGPSHASDKNALTTDRTVPFCVSRCVPFDHGLLTHVLLHVCSDNFTLRSVSSLWRFCSSSSRSTFSISWATAKTTSHGAYHLGRGGQAADTQYNTPDLPPTIQTKTPRRSSKYDPIPVSSSTTKTPSSSFSVRAR